MPWLKVVCVWSGHLGHRSHFGSRYPIDLPLRDPFLSGLGDLGDLGLGDLGRGPPILGEGGGRDVNHFSCRVFVLTGNRNAFLPLKERGGDTREIEGS